MGIFSRSLPSHLIPINPVNAGNKDWLVVIEAGTIVGPSTERLRVRAINSGTQGRQEI